ncbi:MAG: hypothetical protein LM573_07435 [Thermofilum sp.]|nr:hypothetical protein [Thermofilum sp.]
MKTIGIRGLSEELLRRVKAVASLRGIRVSDAFQEALTIWLSIRPEVLEKFSEIEAEAELNRKALQEKYDELVKDSKGKYVAVARGKILGIYETLEEAAQAVEGASAKQGIIEKIEPRAKKETELGWSLVEL